MAWGWRWELEGRWPTPPWVVMNGAAVKRGDGLLLMKNGISIIVGVIKQKIVVDVRTCKKTRGFVS